MSSSSSSSKLWLYNQPQNETDAAWKLKPHFKPSPTKVKQRLLSINDQPNENLLFIYDAVTNVHKQCILRNEMQAFANVDVNDKAIIVKFLNDELDSNGGNQKDALSLDAQIKFCKSSDVFLSPNFFVPELGLAEQRRVYEFLTHVVIGGFIINHTKNRRWMMVVFRHHLKSLKIKMLRSIFSVLREWKISKVLMLSSAPLTPKNAETIAVEYEEIDFELWSTEDYMFDFWSSGNVNMMLPMRPHCGHPHQNDIDETSVTTTTADATKLCPKCESERSKILETYGGPNALSRFPFLPTSDILAQRLALEKNTILVSQRYNPQTLFYRTVVSPSGNLMTAEDDGAGASSGDEDDAAGGED